MLLIHAGFTPKQIDEEFSWLDIERYLTVLPYLDRLHGTGVSLPPEMIPDG
jgi:hypothetical protein